MNYETMKVPHFPRLPVKIVFAAACADPLVPRGHYIPCSRAGRRTDDTFVTNDPTSLPPAAPT